MRNAGSGWTVAQAVFGRRMFYMFALVLFLVVIDVGLVALWLEQTINITKNQVRRIFAVCNDYC